MTPSLTKRGAGTLERRHDNPTDHIRSQVSVFFYFLNQILENHSQILKNLESNLKN